MLLGCWMQVVFVSCTSHEQHSQGLGCKHAWLEENTCRIWLAGKNLFHRKCCFSPSDVTPGERSATPCLTHFWTTPSGLRNAQGAAAGDPSSAVMLWCVGWV